MEHKTPFKELNFNQKVQYIWDYYKIPIIAVIIVIAVAASFVHDITSQKHTALSVVCVNVAGGADTDGDSLFGDVLKSSGYDTSKNEISVNTNINISLDSNGLDYQNMAVLTAHFSAHDYNICFMDDKTFDHYVESETFCDLRDYLDEETIEKYTDALTYTTSESGEKVPVGIRLSADTNSWLADSGLYDSCTFGICYGGDDTKLLKKVSGYILR